MAVVCFYQPDQCGGPADNIGKMENEGSFAYFAICNSSDGVGRHNAVLSLLCVCVCVCVYIPVPFFSEFSACNQQKILHGLMHLFYLYFAIVILSMIMLTIWGQLEMNDAGSGITVSVWSELSDYPIRWDSKVLMMMMDCTEQEYILGTLFSL